MNEYVDKTVKIDPTAIIDRGAKIGKNCKIWQWVHICEGQNRFKLYSDKMYL